MGKTVKYGFENGFQERAAALMVQDDSFLQEAADAVEPSFFKDDDIATVVDLVLALYERHRKRPEAITVRNRIRSYCDKHEIDDETRRAILQAGKRLYRMVLEDTDRDYIREEIIKFGRYQATKSAVMRAVSILEEHPDDPEKQESILQNFQDALGVGVSNQLGLSLFDPSLSSLDDVRQQDVTSDPRYRVPTGFPTLDKVLRGGLGAAEIGVIQAESGVGKSMVLANMAANALSIGKGVVYVTTELKPFDIAIRILTTMLAREAHRRGKRKLDTDEVERRCGAAGSYKKVMRMINKRGGKYLRIVYYPPNTTTPYAISRLLTKLAAYDRQRCDLLVMDYADELRAEAINGRAFGSDESHQALGAIYDGLIQCGKDHLCPTWTASQLNREGYDAEVPKGSHTAGSMKKFHKADFLGTILQTEEDENANRADLFVNKCRRGKQHWKLPLVMDLEHCLVKQRKSRKVVV